MAKYLDDNGLAYLWAKIVAKFYQKPSSGIPKSDLAEGVQTSLGKADSALQEITGQQVTTALGFTPYDSANPSNYQNASEVQSAISTAIGQIEFGKKIRSVDAATTPAGVTWTKIEGGQTVTITGTLVASATVAKNMYLVPNVGETDNTYDEYIVVTNGSTYAWEKIGTTTVDLSGYWAKNELVAITNAEIDTIVAGE